MLMQGRDAFAPARAFEAWRPTAWRQAWPAMVRAGRDRFGTMPLDPLSLAANRIAAPSLAGSLGRMGSLEVRLARSASDIRRAQRLRYEVFYEELSAQPGAMARLTRHDADRFDAFCDHLLVIDHAAPRRRQVVGAYRLLRQEVASRRGGFYSQGEFDVDGLVARHPGLRFLELGRSCVLKDYRDKRTVELLWQGIWAYVRHHRIDAMFGCASFPGCDVAALALALDFITRQAAPEGAWRVRAHDPAPLPPRCGGADLKLAMKTMPALIKGYLRLGAWFGEDAVIDRAFNTIDVLVILPVARINPKYIDYFGEEANRFAA